ncbi:OmpA family protein [Campylobacter sp.]|uniref:OmpA family protein n=1 Tax=Campylobacter sp. TaxID=205 RepID=UPI002AA8A5F0|nr:OmpA family protein [Campylobacter sp.]MCI6662546.1 OmpA family protein [Campylobacter sp.]MCI7550459.1 OmpA family protein [Campylobacter sp.]
MNFSLRHGLVSLPVALALSGCAISENAGKIGGTAIGVGAGAVIGKQIGGDGGMIIGALLGAGVGYLIGNTIDERRAKQKEISQAHNMKIEFENIAKVGDKNTKDKVIIKDKNQFNTGSARLNPKAKEYYEAIAKSYQNNGKKILIVGHTDDTGSHQTNQMLSQDRAKAVGEIFAQNGVNMANIYYQGAGSSKPRADNNTALGRSENRRVEIVELDNENDIAIYAASNNAKKEYFRKNTKQTGKKPKKTQVASQQETGKSRISSTKTKTPDQTTIAKSEKSIKNQSFNVSLKVLEFDKNPNAIDFGGEASSNKLLALSSEYGGAKPGWSFFTQAQASTTDIMANCANDIYRESSEAISLETGKAIKTSEYRARMNGGAWQTRINNHLVALGPVSVLSNGTLAKEPKVFVYKNQVSGSKTKADINTKAKVNTYEGKNGLLYRVFPSKNNAFKCMDIVFDNKKNIAKGYVYYTSKNGELLEKSFVLEPLKN